MAPSPAPSLPNVSAGAADPTARLIAGRYAVDTSRPLPGAGGGLASFAISGHPELMAVQVQRHLPARLQPLQMLTSQIGGVLCPIAHGVGSALPEPGRSAAGNSGYYIVCPAPPGPPVSANLRPWREADLLDLVLRPIAQALEALHATGITHRAIRTDNLFHAGPGQPVVLGAAWAAPPACLQPAIYEPPYSAICLPAGRGDGVPGDEI